jgi:hypothetical protein
VQYKRLEARQNTARVGKYLDYGNACRCALSTVEADGEQAPTPAAIAAERGLTWTAACSVAGKQSFWSFILRSEHRMLVQTKLSKQGKFSCDDVNVVVKKTGRSAPPLMKRCDQTVIDWTTLDG